MYDRHLLPNKHITPYEAWFGIGNKPSISHLRVFGCKAYAHIPDAKRKHKFDGKALECILVGYSNESKAYRLYDVLHKRIIISRDVTFIENVGNVSVESASTSITSGRCSDDFPTNQSDIRDVYTLPDRTKYGDRSGNVDLLVTTIQQTTKMMVVQLMLLSPMNSLTVIWVQPINLVMISI